MFQNLSCATRVPSGNFGTIAAQDPSFSKYINCSDVCCGVSFDICVRCIKSATCCDFVIAVQHLVVDRRSKFLDADHGSSFSCHFR